MNNKIPIAVWIGALCLSAGFLSFGLSDWMNPRSAIAYIDRNPMRPLFRIAFGIVMTMLTIFAAMFVTARMRSKH